MSQQDQLNLLLLSELERMNALFDSLVRRGVITRQDMATAQLQSDLKLAQRRLKVAVECNDREGIAQTEASIKTLAAQIEALTV